MNCLWFCFLGLLCVCLGRHGLCFGFVTILSDKVRRVLSLNCSKQNYFHFYLHSANRAWWSAPVWHFDPHPSTPWISWSSCFSLVCSWWLGFQMCSAAWEQLGPGRVVSARCSSGAPQGEVPGGKCLSSLLLRSTGVAKKWPRCKCRLCWNTSRSLGWSCS